MSMLSDSYVQFVRCFLSNLPRNFRALHLHAHLLGQSGKEPANLLHYRQVDEASLLIRHVSLSTLAMYSYALLLGADSVILFRLVVFVFYSRLIHLKTDDYTGIDFLYIGNASGTSNHMEVRLDTKGEMSPYLHLTRGPLHVCQRSGVALLWGNPRGLTCVGPLFCNYVHAARES